MAVGGRRHPNAISTGDLSQRTGFAPGGGDTDLATAPAANAAGVHNVYVASLTGGDVTVSASQNGGRTWTSNELGATVPADDREWIAASGAGTSYTSYHNLATGLQIIVNEGTLQNGVPTSVQTYPAINPAKTDIYLGTAADNEIGNIAVNQKTGAVFQIFAGCPPSPTAVVNCSGFNTVYMAVGTPQGTTVAGQPVLSFRDHVVYKNPSSSANLANNFPNVAVDAAGNVYASWSDGKNVFAAVSTDHGRTWSPPMKVNTGSAATPIYPWLAAGACGKVDLVYYGTPAAQNYQACTSTSGPYNCQNEPWHVFFAQNLAATGNGG